VKREVKAFLAHQSASPSLTAVGDVSQTEGGLTKLEWAATLFYAALLQRPDTATISSEKLIHRAVTESKQLLLVCKEHANEDLSNEPIVLD